MCDPSASATQTEALDDRAVTADVGLLKVVQEATTLADEEEQATTAVVVVLVLLEVVRQVRDAVRQQRDLDLRRTGAALDGGVLSDDLLLGLRVSSNRHAGLLPVLVARRARACSPGHWDPRPFDGTLLMRAT